MGYCINNSHLTILFFLETKDSVLLAAVTVAQISAFSPVSWVPVPTVAHEEHQMIVALTVECITEKAPQTSGT